MQIIAHRGASFRYPENTLASVNGAWEEGADGTEIDVRLTRDGELLVFHDATLKRTGHSSKAIAELTAEEAVAFDVGSWKSPAFSHVRPSLLVDVLRAIPHGKEIYIEIKEDERAIEPLLKAVADSRITQESVKVIAFSYDTMKALKQTAPQYHVSWIFVPSKLPANSSGCWACTSIETAHAARLNGISIGSDSSTRKYHVETVKKSGLHLNIWTVDYLNDAARYLLWGVDSISSNIPGAIRAGLARLKGI